MNNLKKRLQEGDTLIGAATNLQQTGRPDLERILEKNTYDFLMTDSQHSPFTEPDLVSFCQLAAEFSMPVVFRIMDTKQAYMIGKYLDLGIGGIEVPQVNTPKVAAEAVEKFYYPPLGIRSIGGNFRSQIGMGDFALNDHLDYTGWWNQSGGLLWIQVETVQAVLGAQALARSGVDCLSFGPADLTHDMRFNSHPKLNTVDDCVRHVIKELENTDTVVCFRNFTPQTRQKYIDMGVKVLLEIPPA